MKRKIVSAIVILIATALLVSLAGFIPHMQIPEKFPEKTSINGVDVSGMNVEEAELKLAENMSGKNYSFGYKGKFYNVLMDSLTYDYSLEAILYKWGYFEQAKSLLGIGNKFRDYVRPNESDVFLAKISDLPICDNTGKEMTTDAFVDLSDFDFKVVEEKVGTEVDPNRLLNIAYSNIAGGKFASELTDGEIIKQPKIRVGSEELNERLQYCKDNLSFKLEYEIDGKSEVIPPQTLDEMVVYTEDGPEFKNKIIKSFVTDLASRCNEYNEIYQFKTHGGSVISVQGVNFGQVLDKSSMINDLKKALKAQKSKKLDLNWAQLKYSGGEGIGNSYIEVSIAAQHVWCYKNGNVVVSCDCVTGAPGHDTARGVFVVQYVTGPMTLKGDNGDGTRYESPVNCFIPFYGGQGFHGSNGWRSRWGGNIYKTAGSHGCVNCPDAAAKKMADTVSSGYPVVIY